MDVESELSRISRRGSGRWRPSSASGLSTLQYEGSGDHENWGREGEKMNDRQRAQVTERVEACAVPCRLATWFTHRTLGEPKGKDE